MRRTPVRLTADALNRLSRIAAAVAGGYLFASGCATFGTALLLRVGMARSEAVLALSMLSFVIYLIAGLWAFASRRTWTVWVVLGIGGIAMVRLGQSLILES